MENVRTGLCQAGRSLFPTWERDYYLVGDQEEARAPGESSQGLLENPVQLASLSGPRVRNPSATLGPGIDLSAIELTQTPGLGDRERSSKLRDSFLFSAREIHRVSA